MNIFVNRVHRVVFNVQRPLPATAINRAFEKLSSTLWHGHPTVFHTVLEKCSIGKRLPFTRPVLRRSLPIHNEQFQLNDMFWQLGCASWRDTLEVRQTMPRMLVLNEEKFERSCTVCSLWIRDCKSVWMKENNGLQIVSWVV